MCRIVSAIAELLVVFCVFPTDCNELGCHYQCSCLPTKIVSRTTQYVSTGTSNSAHSFTHLGKPGV